MGKRRRSRSTTGSSSPIKGARLPSISPPPLRRHLTSDLSSQNDVNVGVKERFEIVSWNVNGVSQFLTSDTPKITSFFPSPRTASHNKAPIKKDDSDPESSLRKFLQRHAWPQVVCLQEVKINPQDTSTRRALEKAANSSSTKQHDGGPAYTAHFSLPRDKYNAKCFGGKVHGVSTLLHTSLIPSSVTREVDWDLEGRVLISEFPAWKLAIINGYWVNGTTHSYRSPETGAVVGTRHVRKRQFHRDMLAEVKGYEARGWRVVLVGDMNIAPSLIDGHPSLRGGDDHILNRKDFNEKFLSATHHDGMRGVDTFRHFHGGLRKYTYHGESAERWGMSCDRVDLGIASRSLVEVVRGALLGAEIWESVEERHDSDHVPISVVLDVGKLAEFAMLAKGSD